MTTNKLELRAVSAPWGHGVEFLFMQGNSVGINVQMEQRNDYEMSKPTFSLNNTEAQVLMDDLWNAGVRPTEGTGSAGSLRATEKHLKDMRKIAFNQLQIGIRD